MNQDAVRETLYRVRNAKEACVVIFSGKKSDKVHGLYKPDSREIILHNKNFKNDNELLYTALHEYAHHIQFTESAAVVSSRAHTGTFWNIFHELLETAEEIGVYQNIFKTDPAFIAMTKRIRANYLAGNGALMLEFGKALIEARALCVERRVEFDDYMDRELGLHRNNARTIMNVGRLTIAPEVGYENMKLLARIAAPEKRKEAEAALLEGKSPDTVRMKYVAKPKSENKLDNLIEEKKRVAVSIKRLNARLTQLEREIALLANKQ